MLAAASASFGLYFLAALLFSAQSSVPVSSSSATPSRRRRIHLGPRPFHLVDGLRPSALKTRLQECASSTAPHLVNPAPSQFSISHRGAPLQYPEHTLEGYRAAATMGAGVFECDVVFTADLALVCRHSQCDLHSTTNILATPLAAKCTVPFTAATSTTPASARCCTSDITLAEFRTLRGRMDSFNTDATTPEQTFLGVPSWRTTAHSANGGTLMTHAESIALFRSFGGTFIPELKTPDVFMPFRSANGTLLTTEALAQALLDEYTAVGVDLSSVRAQSKNINHVRYWLSRRTRATPVLLDERFSPEQMAASTQASLEPAMREFAAMGLRIIAPPTWKLVKSAPDGRIVPTDYAAAAHAAGLDIITWTLERSGPLAIGTNEYYYQSVRDATYGDSVVLDMLDVLARDIGVIGVFSDWPATVSMYAACMGL
jgi:glycerophosphoryl diester phosphodiesterase